jgi:hypothetical protein
MRVACATAAVIAAGAVLASPVSAGSAAGVPRLAHAVLIVFENHERSAVLGSAGRTFARLASTYDEGTSDVGGGGHVLLVVAGTAVRRHTTFTAATSHYGLLHTIETALGLPPLGKARLARPLTGIWR